jgi:ankyrin repeat protein
MGIAHRIVLTESPEQVAAFFRREPNRLDEKHDNGLTPLMLCLQDGRADIGRLLLELGASANPTDRYGRTALMFAAEKGFGEVATLLLKLGAEVDATDTADGFNAMDCALLGKHHEVAAILRDAGGHAKVVSDVLAGV